MQLHDEQGVAATSFVDVAKRAGIGAATVYRHFPTLASLVIACGAHVWREMAPPYTGRRRKFLRVLTSSRTAYSVSLNSSMIFTNAARFGRLAHPQPGISLLN
jgi:AcrR family transcriptional regulator